MLIYTYIYLYAYETCVQNDNQTFWDSIQVMTLIDCIYIINQNIENSRCI